MNSDLLTSQVHTAHSDMFSPRENYILNQEIDTRVFLKFFHTFFRLHFTYTSGTFAVADKKNRKQ